MNLFPFCATLLALVIARSEATKQSRAASRTGLLRATCGARNDANALFLSRRAHHSPLIPAALMIGHHLSISAFWKAASPCGVCCSRVATSRPSCAKRALIARLLKKALSFGLLGK